MNHGKDFMLFLRDVYAQATKIGAFNPAEVTNEIPSPWPWENEIFRRGGDVGNEELLAMFLEHKAFEKEKKRAAGEESARKAEADEVAKALATDLGLAKPAEEGSTTEDKSDAPPAMPHEQVDRLAAATPSDVASPTLPPASPLPDEAVEDSQPVSP